MSCFHFIHDPAQNFELSGFYIFRMMIQADCSSDLCYMLLLLLLVIIALETLLINVWHYVHILVVDI